MIFISTIRSEAELWGGEVQFRRPLKKQGGVSYLDSRERTLQRDPLKAPWNIHTLLCKGDFISRKDSY